MFCPYRVAVLKCKSVSPAHLYPYKKNPPTDNFINTFPEARNLPLSHIQQ
jgi:hypothetical protein